MPSRVTFEIRNDRPFPRRYPFDEMKSGDYITVPMTRADIARKRVNRHAPSSAYVSASQFVKNNRPGWKVITERTGDSERIWLADGVTFERVQRF